MAFFKDPSVLQFWSVCPVSLTSSRVDYSLIATCTNSQFSVPRSHYARLLLIFLAPPIKTYFCFFPGSHLYTCHSVSMPNYLLLFEHVPFLLSLRRCMNLNVNNFLNVQILTKPDQLPACSRYSGNTEALIARMSWHRLIPHCPWLIGNWHSFSETQKIASMTKGHVSSSS